MRKIFFVIGCVLLAISSISAAGEAEFKVIEDFRTLSNWLQSPEIKVPSGRYGFKPARDEKGARMWYRGTSGFRDVYHWFWYKINYEVSNYDYVVLEYKLGQGTKFTIDIWFNDKQLVPRAANYITGTGEWQELRIPVRGATLTAMGLSIGEHPSDFGEDRVNEVYFREIRLEKRPLVIKKEVPLPEIIIIPTPKKIKFFNEYLPITSSGKVLFSILLRENPTVTERIGAQELADEISTLSGIKERVSIFTEGETLPEGKSFFALGCDLLLFDKFQVKPPPYREGYIIKKVKYDDKDIVLMAGSDKVGAYWSVQTMLQLLQKKNGELVLPVVEIVDWPTYLYRSMATGRDMQGSKKAVRYKINVLFEPWWSKGLFDRWDNPSEDYIKRLQEKVDFAVKRGININQEIAPHHVNHSREDGKLKAIRSSWPEDIDKLFNTFKLSLERGNRVINLSFDDPARIKESFQPEDIEFFDGNVLEGHAHLVAELTKRVKKEFPDVHINVTTKGYHHAGDVKGYYDAAGVPKDIFIMWTGRPTVTLTFTEDKIKRFKEGIEGRRFIIFDNTPGQMHGKGRGIRMFDLYASGYGVLHKYAYGIHGMQRFLNPPSPELSDILSLTMADYMWNPEAYDAETTVRKVLTKVAGKEAVEHLLTFGHHYLRLASKYPVEKKLAELSAAEKKRSKITEARYKRLKPDIEGVREALEEIKRTSKNVKLTEELESKYKQMVDVIQLLRGVERKTKIYKPQGEIILLPNDFFGGFGYKVYSYLCEPKKAVWIYGWRTNTHTLEAEFELASSPQTDATLIIEGQDDDKEGTTRIEILLNGNLIFKGPNEFVERGWSTQSYPVRKSFMKAGRNVLIIRNLEDSDCFASKWFMLTQAKIVFP